VTRYKDAEAVLRDPDTFSSSINAEHIGQFMGDLILAMNGEEHRKYRNLVAKAFRASQLERWDETLVRPMIDRLLDAIAPLGRADLVASVTAKYPMQVICGIAGVPLEDADQFAQWAEEINTGPMSPERGHRASAAMVEYLRPLVEARRANSTGDFLSDLVHAEVDGEHEIGEEVARRLRAARLHERTEVLDHRRAGPVPALGREGAGIDLLRPLREPVGVAALIVPWNYPLLMAAWKLGPALASGCAVILKPAEQTPLTSLEFAKLVQKNIPELPAGIFNVVTGEAEAGKALVEHMQVDKIAFTGSAEVGRHILRGVAGSNLKKVSLELGGKSPNIFFADADFDAAVEGACNGVFWNQGEICSAGTRVFVESKIYDDALSAMVDHAKRVTVGDGMNEATSMGPLVSKEQQERVLNYIDIGEKEAKLAVKGDVPSDPKLANGYFVPPTIFADATNQDRIAREEIFGPVMTVIPFKEIDEVIAMSNDNEYGLAAAIWTKDIKKAFRAAKALRAGTVWINDTQPAPTEAPWGGYKASGIGRELGPWSMDDYLEIKHIYVNLAED
jgi:acyl-CoA reductase-like NAD-dependent aldehyde dehydrogenase